MSATDRADRIGANRRLISLAILFSAAINLLYFAAPLYFVQVFTRVLSSRSVETLVALSVIVGLCILAVGALEAARALVVRRAGEAADLAFAPAAAAQATRPAGKASPIADLDRVSRLYGSPQLIALLDLPWTLAFVAALGLLHPWLGILAFSGVLILAALSAIGARSTAARNRDAVPARDAHDRVLSGWAGREGLIAALGAEDFVLSRWSASRDAMLRAQSALMEGQAVRAAAGRAIRLALQCAAIGIGAALVLQDAMGAGALFAASLLVSRALAPVEGGVAALFELRAGRAAARRLDAPARPAAPTVWRVADGATEAGLVAERLSFRAAGAAAPALAGVSFSLAPGEALGVVGPSGSGKSVLLAVIAGALPATTGALRLGSGVRAPTRPGYCPQGVGRLDGAVADAIGLGRHDRAAVIDAADAMDLSATIEALPGGLDARLDEPGSAPPAGLRQRIAIARAICGTPPVVLLDEPTANLDSNGERALLDAITALKQAGSIVIVASHRPSVLGLADRLLVLDRGRERASGPRNAVLAELARGALKLAPRPPAERPLAMGA